MNCAFCDQDYPVHGVACGQAWILLPIHERPRTRHWRVLWTHRRPCPECLTPPGCPHHMPCERERCPACLDGQQLTSCLRHFLWAALPSPPRDRGRRERPP